MLIIGEQNILLKALSINQKKVNIWRVKG